MDDPMIQFIANVVGPMPTRVLKQTATDVA